MRQYVNGANVITSGALVCGFAALTWAAEGRPVPAAIAIALAGLCDGLDGVAARLQRTSGRFGSNLDSLADVVAFGAAPALLLWRGTLEELPLLGMATAMVFLLAGAWRLARFSIVEDRARWIGLPIPAAGIAVAGAIAAALPMWSVLLLALALSAMMVSEIPFPTAAEVHRRHKRRQARVAAGEPPPPRRRLRRPPRTTEPPVSVGAAPPHE
jgi:CDP-diacylglycerol--serine O-phosphatidyltransferase